MRREPPNKNKSAEKSLGFSRHSDPAKRQAFYLNCISYRTQVSETKIDSLISSSQKQRGLNNYQHIVK